MAKISLIRADFRLIHGQVITKWLKQSNANRIIIIDDALSKTLGVPTSKILIEAWDRMNINVVKADESKEAIEAFLKLFKLNGLVNLYY